MCLLFACAGSLDLKTGIRGSDILVLQVADRGAAAENADGNGEIR
jgi:hypothetical protein